MSLFSGFIKLVRVPIGNLANASSVGANTVKDPSLIVSTIPAADRTITNVEKLSSDEAISTRFLFSPAWADKIAAAITQVETNNFIVLNPPYLGVRFVVIICMMGNREAERILTAFLKHVAGSKNGKRMPTTACSTCLLEQCHTLSFWHDEWCQKRAGTPKYGQLAPPAPLAAGDGGVGVVRRPDHAA